MANVPFIQYVLPHGEKRPMLIDRPDNIAAAADAIRKQGFRFECEVLTTGEVSFTISDDLGDYASELTPNELGKPAAAVDRLISGFDLAAAIKARKRLADAEEA